MLNIRNYIVKHKEEFSYDLGTSCTCKLKKRTFCVHTV